MTDLSPTAQHVTEDSPVARHWLVTVVVVCLAQFMVILDATITNVALPSIQADLGFSPADLQWVVNVYLLVFGGFLLLGGRAGDLFGRRRLFLAGITLFTAASLLDGLATSPGFLVAARALQGLGAALVSPAALSIITTTVPEGPDRAKALGAFAAISGGGGAVGLLLGGLLTDALSWEWVFFVNVPIGIATLLLALRFVPESRAEDRNGVDFVGATLVTAGLVTLTYAIVKAQDFGWGSARTLALGGAAVALLAVFAVTQARRSNPLVRLSIFRKRTLTTANAVTLFLLSGMQAFFFFGSLYFQQIKGFNALESGAAFVPMTIGIIAGSVISQRLMARFGVKNVLLGGMALGAAGMLWTVNLTPESSYVGGFLPGLALMALGIGNAFVPLTMIATGGVDADDQGLASGLFNTSQQVGGALGLAVLSTFANTATSNFAGGTHAEALVHGYTVAFAIGAGLLALAAVVVAVTLRADEANESAAAAEGVEALAAA
jgi:EmrB/QacA subfamily drug resistance transporter